MELIFELSKLRLPIETMAHSMDISVTTFNRWIAKYEEVSGIIKKGRSQSRSHAVKCAYLRAFPIGKEKPDTALAIFLLKTMFRFKEPDKKIKIEAAHGNTNVVLNVSEELKKDIIETAYDKKS